MTKWRVGERGWDGAWRWNERPAATLDAGTKEQGGALATSRGSLQGGGRKAEEGRRMARVR